MAITIIAFYVEEDDVQQKKAPRSWEVAVNRSQREFIRHRSWGPLQTSLRVSLGPRNHCRSTEIWCLKVTSIDLKCLCLYSDVNAISLTWFLFDRYTYLLLCHKGMSHPVYQAQLLFQYFLYTMFLPASLSRYSLLAFLEGCFHIAFLNTRTLLVVFQIDSMLKIITESVICEREANQLYPLHPTR